MRTYVIILTLVSLFCGTASGRILISNNGPVTFDTPITFTVNNSYEIIAPSYEYRFKFKEYPQHDKVIVSTSKQVSHTVIFESSPAIKEGMFSIGVYVWAQDVQPFEIGHRLNRFYLYYSLRASIRIDQDIDIESLSSLYISTASPVNLTATIYDPDGFFDSANKTYEWIVNGSPQGDSHDQFITCNFSQPQRNNISVMVTVLKTNPFLQKSGFFQFGLGSKNPILDLTVDGQTNIELSRNESLQLNISINEGTPPFRACWSIDSHPECERIEEETFFIITRHFEEQGNKTLTIDVKNLVSTFTKTIPISIHENKSLIHRLRDANKPEMLVVTQETSNVMQDFNPVNFSEEPEVSDNEIENYILRKKEMEFIKELQTSLQSSSSND